MLFQYLSRNFSAKKISYGKVYNSALLPARGLHKFSPPRPEIVVGNNAAIFGTLSSIIRHGEVCHPDVTIFNPPFWLDSIIGEDYDDHDWGQTIYGLPSVARILFMEIYPSHDEEKYITWRQYRELRQYAINQLENRSCVNVISAEPILQQNQENDYTITALGTSINLTMDKFLYSWYRIPRRHGMEYVAERVNTAIYQIPRRFIPDTIIALGAGLSTVWLAKHFPNTRIVCMASSNDKLPDDVPSNSDVNYGKIILIDIERADIVPDRSDPEQGIIDVIDGKTGNRYRGEFFSAIGFEPAWREHPISFQENTLFMPNIFSKWIASKNQPIGSLAQSYAAWVEATNNLSWAFEPTGYHETGFPMLLKHNISYKLCGDYFRALEEYVTASDNPPDEQTIRNRLIKIFEYTYQPTSQALGQFEKELDQLMVGRGLHSNEKDSIHKSVFKI